MAILYLNVFANTDIILMWFLKNKKKICKHGIKISPLQMAKKGKKENLKILNYVGKYNSKCY